MYKVEIVTDTLQQAAIERRRRLDEERKNRIFNPKMRIMGVSIILSVTKKSLNHNFISHKIDVQALEEQIKIKSEIQQMEKERNVAFGKI